MAALQKICAAELAASARSITAQPRVTQVDGTSHSAVTAQLLSDLRTPAHSSVLLVNVLRLVQGHYMGHWSPIGGFAEVPDDAGGASEPWVMLH